MATICEKDYSIEIKQHSLFDYWDFDEIFPPLTFFSKINPAVNRLTWDLNQAVDSNQPGILNTAMRINGVGFNNTASVSTLPNTDLVLTTGFTWTTWVRFIAFGDLSETFFLEAIFLNSSDVEVFRFGFYMLGVGPPSFAICQKNGSTFFSPTRAFGLNTWYFIQIQFDHATSKFGIQVGDSTFGLGGMEESTAIADDLSSIAKGYLKLRCHRDTFSSASPDYRQDESGLWLRLLTNAEVIQLFGSGTAPPAYPAIPQ